MGAERGEGAMALASTRLTMPLLRRNKRVMLADIVQMSLEMSE